MTFVGSFHAASLTQKFLLHEIFFYKNCAKYALANERRIAGEPYFTPNKSFPIMVT